VLKSKAAVCAGYSNLYNEMCRLAKIESTVIHGYSKGFGYRGSLGPAPDHAWNAVNLNSKWYLVDVTWDAGYVDTKTFIKRYSGAYLFTDSRSFLYSHLPDQESRQFYAPVLSAGDFQKEAYIPGEFFQYGIELKSDKPLYNNAINGTFSFDITSKNNNVTLNSELRTSAQAGVAGAAWLERSGTAITFYYDVPDSGDYKGLIFARAKDAKKLQERVDIASFERNWLPGAAGLLADKKITQAELDAFRNAYFKVAENGMYYFIEDQFDTQRNNAVSKIHGLLELSTSWMDPVISFNIKAADGYKGYGSAARKYPFTYSTFKDASNTKLISPVTGILKPDSTELFSISSKDYTRFAVIINGEFTYFEKKPSGNYELSFKVPTGVQELTIAGSKDGKSYTSLVRFDVTSSGRVSSAW
jgi:hypothetical protein